MPVDVGAAEQFVLANARLLERHDAALSSSRRPDQPKTGNDDPWVVPTDRRLRSWPSCWNSP